MADSDFGAGAKNARVFQNSCGARRRPTQPVFLDAFGIIRRWAMLRDPWTGGSSKASARGTHDCPAAAGCHCWLAQQCGLLECSKRKHCRTRSPRRLRDKQWHPKFWL